MSREHEESLEVSVPHGGEVHKEKDFMTPEANMVLLTWLVFFCLLAILKKFAWKPILAKLDEREKEIDDSLKNADHIKEELAKIEQKCQALLQAAEQQSHDMLEQSKRTAMEAAKVIQQRAKDESKILLDNALREISEEKQKAQAFLKQESADIIVTLASKLIHENLDDDKNRRLVDDLIKGI